jgi:hypothetical protein
MAAPSTTAAQLIADVANNATAILQSPPTPAPPTPDNGPDVDDIIAAAEQMDLEQAARHSGLQHDDLFGRVTSVCHLLVNVLILLILAAAFHGMQG